MTTKLISSAVVPDFRRVELRTELSCPECGTEFSPQCVLFDGGAIILRCKACHRDSLRCTLEVGEGDDAD